MRTVHKIRAFLLCLLASLPLGASDAFAQATIYVSPSGNDTTGNGSISNPYATVVRGVNAASSGSEVILRAGNYASTMVTFLVSNVTLRAASGEQVDIDFTTATNGIGLWVRADNISIKNLNLHDSPVYNIKVEIGSTDGLIEGCKIHDSMADNIKVTQGANNLIVQNNEIYNTKVVGGNAQGLDIVNSHDIIVRDNYFHDIADIAVHAKGGARNVIIERNFFKDVALGPHLGQTTDTTSMNLFNENPQYYENIDGIVRNNVIVNTSAAGIAIWAALRPKVYNNTIINAAAGSQGAIYIRDIGHEGIAFYTPTVDPEIRNNVIVLAPSSARAAVVIKGDGVVLSGTFTISNNRYFQQGRAVPFWDERPTGGNFNLTQWKAYLQGDTGSTEGTIGVDAEYRPIQGSPLIDAGYTLTTLVSDDKDGAARPAGSTYDIGAFEYGAQGGSPTATPSPTHTGLPTNTPTPSGTSTPQSTSTPNITPTRTPPTQPTNSPTVTPTATPSLTPKPPGTVENVMRIITRAYSPEMFSVWELESIEEESRSTNSWTVLMESETFLLLDSQANEETVLFLSRTTSGVKVTSDDRNFIIPAVPTNTRFIRCENNLFVVGVNKVITYSLLGEQPQLKNVRSASAVRYLPTLTGCTDKGVLVIAYRPIGQANGSGRNRRLGKIKSGKLKEILRPSRGTFLGGAHSLLVANDKDGKLTLAVLYDGVIKIYDLLTGALTEQRISKKSNKEIFGFSQDGCITIGNSTTREYVLSCAKEAYTVDLEDIGNPKDIYRISGPIVIPKSKSSARVKKSALTNFSVGY